ncbi:enoyl-CoA hydratase [Marinobacterium nitratireducens]|uniref:Enoyl-CoA hydratase n=1 Tax=Marinobacterium nitratireducens TaxID=518897 RepID=A0A917ZIL0_9GAMM|nr:enoyl-CoA hydratase/isomerase family protein [Marinobacterium nitratireducens]GGO83901.1 enoyl-CoA hydratase [Marinobacterium nitratireducens]
MIVFEVADCIARLEIRRAGRCNALTASMLEQLNQALGHIETNPQVRVVLISAEGERFFSSGADIDDWGDLDAQAMGHRWIRQGNRVFQRLAELPVPVVCGLRGRALGGGAELALAADIRIATEDVEFGFPETSIGAIPGWTGCARLAEGLGIARARSLVLSGELLDAATLLESGLVSEVVPPQDLEQALYAWAGRLGRRSGTAMAAAKQVFGAMSSANSFAPVHELAATVCRGSADGQEGIEAFRQKRAPKFT